MIKMIMNIWVGTLFFCMTLSGMHIEKLEEDFKQLLDCNNKILQLQRQRETVQKKTEEHYGLGNLIEQQRQQRDVLTKKIADKVDKKLAKL